MQLSNFLLLFVLYYLLARGMCTLRLFNLSWRDLGKKKGSKGVCSLSLTKEALCDGILLIVLSFTTLVSMFLQLPPSESSQIFDTLLPGLFAGWTMEILRRKGVALLSKDDQWIFFAVTTVLFFGSLYWLWVEVSS